MICQRYHWCLTGSVAFAKMKAERLIVRQSSLCCSKALGKGVKTMRCWFLEALVGRSVIEKCSEPCFGVIAADC